MSYADLRASYDRAKHRLRLAQRALVNHRLHVDEGRENYEKILENLTTAVTAAERDVSYCEVALQRQATELAFSKV